MTYKPPIMKTVRAQLSPWGWGAVGLFLAACFTAVCAWLAFASPY